jgi:putative hemolysin
MDENLVPKDIFLIVLLFILIFLSAFFSGSETSFFSLNRYRLLHLIRKKVKPALKVKKLLDDKESLLGAILLGNNLVNVATSSVATYLFLKYFGDSGIVYATAGTTFILLIFAEITPKVYSSTYPEKVAFFSVYILDKIIIIFKPFLFITNACSNVVLKIFRIKSTKEKIHISKDELKTLILTGEKAGLLDSEKTEMLNNLLNIENLIVKDILIPRIEVKAINLDAPLNEIFDIIKNTTYSRYPVYKDSIDNILGVLHTKKVLRNLINKKDLTIKDIEDSLQEVYYTSEFTKVEFLLKKMKQKNIHMAIVVDEYGGFEGIVTLEDILEEIVGEIHDEFDNEIEKFIKINENTYIINGDFPIKKFNEMFETELPHEDESTMAGFFISIIGKLPAKDDEIEYDKFVFKVLNVEKRTIKRLKVIIKNLKPENSQL